MALVTPSNENPIPARFQVLEQLARGEDEVVVRARDTLLQREVVLKRPMPCGFGGAPDAAELARSLREARTLARVQHPGVVRLIDVIETRDGPMLVMEPVPGESLAERIIRDGRPTPEAVRQLGISVCAALEVVHAAGIVHRGVSTSNIVMRDGASPVLTGFNFAKFGPGGSGTMPGTSFLYRPSRADGAPPAVVLPPHPAPEQILGQAADARSDLFGLGWVMYELLTGEPPYSQEVDVERWTSPKDPRKLASETPRGLADAVLKCLQTSPLKRFASANAVRVALEQCAPVAAGVAGSAAQKPSRSKGLAIAAAGTAALVVAAWFVAPMLGLRNGSSSADAATNPSDGALRGVEGERGVAATLSRAAYDPHYREQWAVVIGIDDYEHWPKLDYAVADARGVKDLLVAKFGFEADHVFELMDKDATRDNIQRLLGGVLPEKTQRNDGVFVFFAGHGATRKLPEGGDMGFLVPVDGTSLESEYMVTLLPMAQIRQFSDLIPAKHGFFAVDACYGGLAAAERGMEPSARPYVAQLASLRSRQILTAGGKGEKVIEKPEWGHSAFTKTFLEGLDSGVADSDQDGVITSGEIGSYIKTRVPKISDFRQTPQFKNLSDDEGEFLFLRAH
jgi:tRNA A-37 threonylcarbamoyl transferase component Bud32